MQMCLCYCASLCVYMSVFAWICISVCLCCLANSAITNITRVQVTRDKANADEICSYKMRSSKKITTITIEQHT